jgi:hypothetical protein
MNMSARASFKPYTITFFRLPIRDAKQYEGHDCMTPVRQNMIAIMSQSNFSFLNPLLRQELKPLSLWWMLETIVGREMHAC